MAIRIKSERIHAMAKELAALTGQSQVAAITQALEERLAHIQADKEGVADQVARLSNPPEPDR